jgi:hypothetical protein
MKKSLLFALALTAAPALGHAYGAAGTVAAPYLELPMGARGTGMGEAFTGVADDVNSIYYNPAGLTALETSQLEAMHIDSFGGIAYENLGLAVPTDLLGLDWWGTVALGYTLVGIDDTLRTQALPGNPNVYDQAYADNGYMYTAGASVVSLSYAWQATKLYSVGATIKVIDEKIDTAEGWGVAGDVGLLTRPELIPGLSAGFTLQNFGTSPQAGSSLPTDARFGVGYDIKGPFTGPINDDKLRFDADLILPVAPVDYEAQLNLGGEYTRYLGDAYGILRAGYRFPQTELGAEAGMTLGGGLGTHLPGLDLTLDYAWVPYGELGYMQRIALTGTFGAKPRIRGQEPFKGLILYPPVNVTATAGSKSARVTWDPQSGRVDGYNLYMTYNPNSGQWTRLNKAPITTTSLDVKSLYNGYKIYFAVSTLARKGENLYQESQKSQPIMVIPQAAPAAASTQAAPVSGPGKP